MSELQGFYCHGFSKVLPNGSLKISALQQTEVMALYIAT